MVLIEQDQRWAHVRRLVKGDGIDTATRVALSRLLGLHISRAGKWVKEAGSTRADYAAEISRRGTATPIQEGAGPFVAPLHTRPF